MIQIMALDYSTEWYSAEGEEQMPNTEPWGMPHEVGCEVKK